MRSLLTTIAGSTLDASRTILRYRKIIWATTRVELAKRYSGSALGLAWVFLHPALLLSIYIFVYVVIFKVRFPGYAQSYYVLYIFSGLIPYLGFWDAISGGSLCIKQNIHLVKNVMLPIELIPVRAVAVGMVTQVVSTGILILLVGFKGSLTFHLLWLPLVFILQLMFLVGLVWILAALAVVLPDISYFINLFLLLLMYISPIGFTPDMIPSHLKLMIYLNPIYYMLEMYRDSILKGQLPAIDTLVIYVIMCIGFFALGAAFFKRFKSMLVDYE
jgi:lipopolysaccharide transport system permease protein